MTPRSTARSDRTLDLATIGEPLTVRDIQGTGDRAGVGTLARGTRFRGR